MPPLVVPRFESWSCTTCFDEETTNNIMDESVKKEVTNIIEQTFIYNCVSKVNETNVNKNTELTNDVDDYESDQHSDMAVDENDRITGYEGNDLNEDLVEDCTENNMQVLAISDDESMQPSLEEKEVADVLTGMSLNKIQNVELPEFADANQLNKESKGTNFDLNVSCAYDTAEPEMEYWEFDNGNSSMRREKPLICGRDSSTELHQNQRSFVDFNSVGTRGSYPIPYKTLNPGSSANTDMEIGSSKAAFHLSESNSEPCNKSQSLKIFGKELLSPCETQVSLNATSAETYCYTNRNSAEINPIELGNPSMHE
ncbi:hypothetical protein VNO78_30696 [Psophocarpus tetragonolobus]|uniref:Uncharacterized protein n=1 Tax=Psophocarpus tetragonolobus TaxID=3891 RepID=A0AAN9X751_PSOTE